MDHPQIAPIMDRNLDIHIEEALKAYLASGVEDQVDYQKFYLYSIATINRRESEYKESIMKNY